MTDDLKRTDYIRKIHYHEAGHFYSYLLFNTLFDKFTEPTHYNIKFAKVGICNIAEVVVKPEFKFSGKKLDFEHFNIDTEHDQLIFSLMSMGFHVSGCVTHRVYWEVKEDTNYRIDNHEYATNLPSDHDFTKFNYCCRSIKIYCTSQRFKILTCTTDYLLNLFSKEEIRESIEVIAYMMRQKDPVVKISKAVLNGFNQNSMNDLTKPLIDKWETGAKNLVNIDLSFDQIYHL